MLSQRLYHLLAFCFHCGNYVGCSSRLFNFHLKIFFNNHHSQKRVLRNLVLLIAWGICRILIIFKFRRSNDVANYNLAVTCFMLGQMLLLVYGVEVVFPYEVTRCLNAAFRFYRHLHRN